MKKHFLFGILIISLLFLLTACFSNEREEFIENGKEAYANGNLQEAYQHLEKARMMEDFMNNEEEADITTIYQDTVNQLYVQYVKNGDKAVENRNYEEAIAQYQAAIRLYSGDNTLANKLSNAEDFQLKQEEFNEYITFFSGVIRDSNELLSTLNHSLNDVYLDKISDLEFVEKMKDVVPLSNDILSRFDDVYDTVDSSLYDIHESLHALLYSQHDLFIQALDAMNPEFNFQQLSTKHEDVKRTQSNVIRQLKEYGETNQLKVQLNFENIADTDTIQDTKEVEEVNEAETRDLPF